MKLTLARARTPRTQISYSYLFKRTIWFRQWHRRTMMSCIVAFHFVFVWLYPSFNCKWMCVLFYRGVCCASTSFEWINKKKRLKKHENNGRREKINILVDSNVFIFTLALVWLSRATVLIISNGYMHLNYDRTCDVLRCAWWYRFHITLNSLVCTLYISVLAFLVPTIRLLSMLFLTRADQMTEI